MSENNAHADQLIDFIRQIFMRRGSEAYLGESVTMSEHMLQCAMLAETQNASDEMIAAALLHDVGHFSNDFPKDAFEQSIDNRHEEAGAALLAPVFPDLVVDCVRHHVAAKRYLCAVDASYFSMLSEASVHTLQLQGGAMSADETLAFEEQAHLGSILQVRRWDESSKIAAKPTPPFDHYLPLIRRVCAPHVPQAIER